MDWSASATWLIVVPLTVATVYITRRTIHNRIERKGCLLPPGPTPLPLLGNVLSINVRVPWLTYTAWREKYGDIMYIRHLGTDLIVVNSTTVAMELLEKRSKIYSDRPFIPALFPYGFGFDFGLLPYGEHWRLCRRIFQQTFRSGAAAVFRPMQLRRARELVMNIIDDPNQYPFHFSTFSTAIAMCAVYDYRPNPRNDPMVMIVDNFLRVAMPGLSPGKSFLFMVFPFLLHLPPWFPAGSWVKREAKEACMWSEKMIEAPYQFARERALSKDHINTGMVSDHVTLMEKFDSEDIAHRSEYERALKHASATTLLASGETTSTVLMTFTLAMIEHPHVWKRAQAAIDAVIGTDRLPEYEDRPSLPYADAIVRETLRWRPATPLNIPHAATQSDIYKGYYIPEGASVVVNLWGISRDEARYPDADKFMPERFINSQGTLTADNPAEFIFGYGRRKCPGRYTADASIWIAITTMLATLDFKLATDADGNDITFKATFTNGFTDRPNAFPCQLTPRPHVSREVLERVLGAE